MTTLVNPAIPVRTVKPDRDPEGWMRDSLAERRWNVTGRIVLSKTGHGLVYRVDHDDGTSAWYEPRELVLIGGDE